MSLRFASARTPSGSPTARIFARKAPGRPANDNRAAGVAQPALVIDGATRAALRLLASHGLAAADIALTRAAEAGAAGDALACDWWMEVCGALDPRLAARGRSPSTASRPQAV